jgi:hypothetical protein
MSDAHPSLAEATKLWFKIGCLGRRARSPSCTVSWWTSANGSAKPSSSTRSISACCCPVRKRSSSLHWRINLVKVLLASGAVGNLAHAAIG